MTCYTPKNAILQEFLAVNDKNFTLSKKKLKFIKEDEVQKFGTKVLKIKCGKCIGCKIDKANDWATRCYLETKQWQNSCFLTITYNDKNLPKNRSLKKSDIQKFLKRLRHHHKGIEYWNNPRTGKKEKPIRYLYCGEYGPKTLRPHYHMALWNWKPTDLKYFDKTKNGDILYTSKELEKIWGNGFILIGNLEYQSSSYIARYTTKKIFEKNNITGREPEYIDMSRNGGIGLSYWKENKEQLKNLEHVYIKTKDGTKIKNLPAYYIKQWEKEEKAQEISYMKELKKMDINKQQKIDIAGYLNRYVYKPIWEISKLFKFKEKNQQKAIEKTKNILKNTNLTEEEYRKMIVEGLKEKHKRLKRNDL